MKNVIRFAFLLALIIDITWSQSAGSSATQVVIMEVKRISQISISGNLMPLIINDAVAGSELTPVIDGTTTYSIVTNNDDMKIGASINSELPAGISLKINMTSSKATSLGTIDISNALAPVDVVVGIRRGSDANQAINYIFSANADVSEITTETRTIIFTLTN